MPRQMTFRVPLVALLFTIFPVAYAQSSATSHVGGTALDRYAGQYRSVPEPEIIISVFRDGDHLAIESARSPHEELTAESTTSFTVKETPQHLVFVTNAAGKVTGIRRKVGSSETLLERISDQPIRYHFR